MEDIIRRLALQNALKFKGKADPKAIIGGLLQERPEAKGDMKDAMQAIAKAVADVNKLSSEQQRAELLKLDPSYEDKQQELKAQRREERSALPDLPGAIDGKVVTRIPPEPSKYNHLGHAMSFLINYLYAKKYHGKVFLRFDDTNPEKAKQEYVDAVFEDVVDFLGVKPDQVKYASDHMQQYYDYAQQLIAKGQAYVCACAQQDVAKGRREMHDCSHRQQSAVQNAALWERMKAGELDEGSNTLRLKIDMRHKNAVMRDPVIYRLAYEEHYRQGAKYKVWPMYDFECAVEEGLCGVTHVMRSNEFDSRIELQNHIASLLGFPPVTYIHYGRYNVTGATTQGREIRSLIESGEYLGWDDPRLVTLRALRRRGIVNEAFYELAQKIGLSKTQTNLDFSTIAAINRKLLDQSAKRLFAVRDPVVVKVTGMPPDLKVFALAYHPDGEKGGRVIAAAPEYYIERKDHEAARPGVIIRFMDAMNLRKVDDHSYAFVSKEYDDYRPLKQKGPLIHFVPKDGLEVSAEALLPDLSRQILICEANVKGLKQGEVVQFERYAFCRLDRQGEKPFFYYAHE